MFLDQTHLPVVVRTGLPTLMADLVDLEVEGVETVGVTAGGDSAGAEDVTAGAVFTDPPKAANPLPKPDPNPVVFTALDTFELAAEGKKKCNK